MSMQEAMSKFIQLAQEIVNDTTRPASCVPSRTQDFSRRAFQLWSIFPTVRPRQMVQDYTKFVNDPQISTKHVAFIMAGIARKDSSRKIWNEIATLDTDYYSVHESLDFTAGKSVTEVAQWKKSCVFTKGVLRGFGGCGIGTTKQDAINICYDNVIKMISALFDDKQRERVFELYDHIDYDLMEHQSEATAVVDVANNTTVVQNTSGGTITKDEEIVDEDFLQGYITENELRPDEFVNRWIHLTSIDWTDSGLNGAQHVEYDLPRHLLTTSPTLCNSLNMALWRLNRLQRTDIDIKFICSAQPMAVGKVLAKVFYDAISDRDFEHRVNKSSMSHGNPIMLTPGAKVNGTIHAKYNNRNALLPNQQTEYDREGSLRILRLVLAELNPLRITVAGGVTIQILIKFSRAVFSGRIDGGFLNMQGLISDAVNSSPGKMVSETVSEAERMLASVRSTNNEDNPPNPFQRVPVIPQFVDSFCAGTGIDQLLKQLRMDPSGKKPSVLKHDEKTTLSDIAQDRGWYRSFTWNTSQARGTVLDSFPVAYVNDPDDYTEISIGNITASAMPPLDIVASCFVYGAGRIKYDVEPIVSKFHNGSLAIVIVPLVDENDVLIPIDIHNSANVKRDVHALGMEQDCATVIADYFNLNTLMGTKSGERHATTVRRNMGMLHVIVAGQLTANQATTQTVDVNVYKYGAEDVEFMEVKNAILSPSFDAPVLRPVLSMWRAVHSVVSDWYLGTGVFWTDGDHAIVRYGVLPGEIEGFVVPRNRNWTVGRIVGDEATNNVGEVNMTGAFTITALGAISAFSFDHVIGVRAGTDVVAIPLIKTYVINSVILTPPPTFFTGLHTVLTQWANTNAWRVSLDRYNVDMGSAASNFFHTFFAGSTRVSILDIGPQYFEPEVFDMQADTSGVIMTDKLGVAIGNTKTKPSTGWGYKIFGETSRNMADIMRRKRYVAKFQYNPRTGHRWPAAAVALQLCHFTPPADYTDAVHATNRWTTQMLLMSAFTYVSGSIDRTIIGAPIPDHNMWVNHRVFDKPDDDRQVVEFDEDPPVYVQTIPTEMTNLTINSQLTVQCPWKQENVRNVLMRRKIGLADKSIRQCYDIGVMHVGFQSSSAAIGDNADYDFNVFDSYGDDTEFSVYRGFVPMVFNERLEEEAPQARKIYNHEGVFGFITERSTNYVQTQVDVIKTELGAALKEGSAEGLNTAMAKIETIFTAAVDDATNLNFKKLSVLLLGEGLHMFANPNKRTLLASLANILVQIGFFNYSLISTLIAEVEKLVGGGNEPEDAADIKAHESIWGEKVDRLDTTEDAMSSIVSICVTAICQYIGWNSDVVKSVPWKTKLTFAIPSFFGGAYTMKRFFDNFFPMFRYLLNCIMKLKVYLCDEQEAGIIASSENFLTNWVDEVRFITSTKGHLCDANIAARAHLAAKIAAIIQTKLLMNNNRYNLIRDYASKIITYVDDMEQDGVGSLIREEPYSTWWAGPPGCGKSHVSDFVISKLMAANNIPIPHEKTLSATPTSKYLNRCAGQPELKIDDFCAVTDPEVIATQLSYVFDACSCAPWIPNQADLSDKNKTYAPKFFTVLSNSLCPVNLPIQNMDALLRRRNATIRVTGNKVGLTQKFGKEFTDLESQDGFIYGSLPSKMRENYFHLIFTIMLVSKEHLVGKAIEIDGRTEHTVEQLIKILDDDYKTFAENSAESYSSRVNSFWEAKNLPVPEMVSLMDVKSDPNLELLVASWIADYENSHQHMHKIDALLKKMNVANVPASWKDIFLRHYAKKHESQAIGDNYKELARSRYATEDMQEFLNTHADKIEYGFNNWYIKEQDGKKIKVPLHYVMMQQSFISCSHRMTGVPLRDYDIMLAEDGCSSQCLWDFDARTVNYIVNALPVGGQQSCYQKIKNKLAGLTHSLKDIFQEAKNKIAITCERVYANIKIFGVNIWTFMKEHWISMSAIIAGFIGTYWIYMSRNDEDSYICKITHDGGCLTKTGRPFMLASAAKERVLSYFGSKDAQAYNEKVRTVRSHHTTVKQQQAAVEVTDSLINTIRAGYFTIHCDMLPEWSAKTGIMKAVFNLFGYGGRKALMIRHEYEIMMQYGLNFKVCTHTAHGKRMYIDIRREDLEWKQLEHYDEGTEIVRSGSFGIITMPQNFPARKTLIRSKGGKISHSYFQDGHDNDYSGKAMLIIPPTESVSDIDGEKTIIMKVSVFEDMPYVHHQKPITSAGQSKAYETATIVTHSNNYRYTSSRPGHCLGMLVDAESGKIMGIHYCGDRTYGFAERIETKHLEPDAYYYEEPELGAITTAFDAIEAIIMPLGISRVKHHQSAMTGIRKSVIHGSVAVKTAIAILSPGDPRNNSQWSPLYEGVKKHGQPPLGFPKKWVKQAKNDMYYMFSSINPAHVVSDGSMRHFTFEECIFGVPGILNSVDFTTSLGHGWQDFKGQGKRGVVDPDKRWVHSELMKRVTTMLDSFIDGVVPFVIATDCLKDETLGLEKVCVPGKTRIISTLPFEYQIILRMVTAPFIAAQQKFNFQCENAIGISVLGENEHQFDQLGKMMEGRHIVCIDFGNFGPGADSVVVSECLDLIAAWYGRHGCSRTYQQFVRTVLEVLLCTPHLAYDKVYKTCSGIISGSGVTVNLNSMVHSMYIRIAALGLGMSLDEFDKHVQLITYGDDGIMSVSDKYKDIFNVETLHKFFKRYNIKCTGADKGEIMQPHCALREASFLKHSFVLRDSKYMAALQKDSIENQLNWISRKGNPYANTLRNAETALEQAYSHGEEYYEELRALVTTALCNIGKFVVFPDYATARIYRYREGRSKTPTQFATSGDLYETPV